MTTDHGNDPGMTTYKHGTQPFHTDLNPDLAKLVDDFLAEIDRLLLTKERAGK